MKREWLSVSSMQGEKKPRWVKIFTPYVSPKHPCDLASRTRHCCHGSLSLANVTLDHKTSHKLHGYIFSNSQKIHCMGQNVILCQKLLGY